jgi:hypothetical protein
MGLEAAPTLPIQGLQYFFELLSGCDAAGGRYPFPNLMKGFGQGRLNSVSKKFFKNKFCTLYVFHRNTTQNNVAD